MRVRIQVTPDAAEQTKQAKAWWKANRRAAPTLFREELGQALELLREAPEMGAPYPLDDIPGLRRWPLSRTRYHVYYVYDARARLLVILAVWSMSREKGPPLRLV